MSTIKRKSTQEIAYTEPNLFDEQYGIYMAMKNCGGNASDFEIVTNTISEDYTLLDTDEIVLANALASSITITLPVINSVEKNFLIKKIDTSNNIVTIVSHDDNSIEGNREFILQNKGDFVHIVSDENTWHIPGLAGDSGNIDGSVNLFAQTANMLDNLFYQHKEEMLGESLLKNTFVFFGNEFNKLSSYENVTFRNGNLQIESNATTQVFNSCDSLSDIETLSSQGNVSLNQNSDYCKTGNTNWKVTLTGGGKYEDFSFHCKSSWSKTNAKIIRCWVYGKDGAKLQLTMNDFFVSGSTIILKDGWQQVSFDVSGVVKTQNKTFGFIITPMNAITPFDIYIDDITYIVDNSYVTSGNCQAETITIDTERDIVQVFFHPFYSRSDSDTITFKLSLDNGATWHSVNINDFGKWLDISGWKMAVKNKLKIKVELATTDNTKSPSMDDFFITYKF